MKNIIKLLIIPAVALLFVACNPKNNTTFDLQGNLLLPEKTEVKLLYLGVEQSRIFDSVSLSDEKSFVLSGELNNPALFSLRISGRDDIFLVIHPDDKIILEIDNSIAPIAYTVQGSTDSRLVNQLMTQHQRTKDDITLLSIEYEKSKFEAVDFSKQKAKFDSIYDNILYRHKEFSTDFIKSNTYSLACIFALYQNFGKQKSIPLFDPYSDIDLFNLVDSNLTALFPETEAVIALNRDVTQIKEQIKHKKFSENLIVAGRKAPSFELTSINNENIRLNDYEGEPVIFTFFALWNRQSVEEILELNNMLKKYKYRNLNIIAVSFDTDPERLTAFINENGISFPVVCDYMYWESGHVQQFGVRSIPDMLLLDKNHIIHKRNINTSELVQILNEWKKSD